MMIHFVIVNYNSGEWLSKAVASVIEHAGEIPWQLSVVDNASSDNSMAQARGFVKEAQGCVSEAQGGVNQAQDSHVNQNIDCVCNEQNIGFTAANNQIRSQSSADFFILMNPDCELASGSISTMLKAFEQSDSWGLASCRILNEDGSLQATCRRRFPTPWSALVRMLLLDKLFPNNPRFGNFDYGNDVASDDSIQEVEAISGAFMVVRASALKDVGLLDEGYFMHCEDLDWCKRFHLASWAVGFVPKASVTHAKGVSSKSRPIAVLWTLHKGMNRFFDKYYKASYAFPIRYLVKIGILFSFAGRSLLALVR